MAHIKRIQHLLLIWHLFVGCKSSTLWQKSGYPILRCAVERPIHIRRRRIFSSSCRTWSRHLRTETFYYLWWWILVPCLQHQLRPLRRGNFRTLAWLLSVLLIFSVFRTRDRSGKLRLHGLSMQLFKNFLPPKCQKTPLLPFGNGMNCEPILYMIMVWTYILSVPSALNGVGLQTSEAVHSVV